MNHSTTKASSPQGAAPDNGGGADSPSSPSHLAKWLRTEQTRDGVLYRIRPIQPDDLERDRAFIVSLSGVSRYNRMMGTVREPSPDLLDHFVHVDYCREMAFVAVVGEGRDERIIGVARYAGNPLDCECAVAVADAWQSRGIGTTLMRLLLEYARAHGVRRISGTVLGNNGRMLNLANFLEMSTRRCDDDVTLVEAWRKL
jgi:acetyltransferase